MWTRINENLKLLKRSVKELSQSCSWKAKNFENEANNIARTILTQKRRKINHQTLERKVVVMY